MNKKVIFFLTVFISFISLSYANAQLDLYHFNNPALKKEFKTLTWQLRCLVCQNQNIAESNAGLAIDLRHEIAEKLNAGFSKQEIIKYLVHRYGDFILYKPPVNQNTWILWYGPFLLLIVGLAILFFTIMQIRKRNPDTKKLNCEEQQRLRQLLKKMDNNL